MHFLLQIKIQLLYLTNKYKNGHINDQDTLIEQLYPHYFPHTCSLDFLVRLITDHEPCIRDLQYIIKNYRYGNISIY